MYQVKKFQSINFVISGKSHKHLQIKKISVGQQPFLHNTSDIFLVNIRIYLSTDHKIKDYFIMLKEYMRIYKK